MAERLRYADGLELLKSGLREKIEHEQELELADFTRHFTAITSPEEQLAAMRGLINNYKASIRRIDDLDSIPAVITYLGEGDSYVEEAVRLTVQALIAPKGYGEAVVEYSLGEVKDEANA